MLKKKQHIICIKTNFMFYILAFYSLNCYSQIAAASLIKKNANNEGEKGHLSLLPHWRQKLEDVRSFVQSPVNFQNTRPQADCTVCF